MAKKKTQKGLLFYLFCILGVALGVICLFLSILIFNPGKDVYGIGVRYVSKLSTQNIYKTSSEVDLHGADYHTIMFDTQNADVSLSFDNTVTQTKIQIKNLVSAFSKEEDIEYKLNISIEDKVLKISLKEPNLWIKMSNKITINFVCGSIENFSNKNIEIKTISGDVYLGSKKPAKDDYRDIINLNALTINTESGNIEIFDNVTVNSDNINLTADSSKIYINSGLKDELNASLKNVNIESKKYLKLNLEKLAGSLSINSLGEVYANCGNISGNVKLFCKTGFFNANNIGKSGSSLGNFTTLYDGVENTNIIIEKVFGSATIKTSKGYVSINNLLKSGIITTTSGNVNVNNAKQDLTVNTYAGDINVVFDSSELLTLKSISGSIKTLFKQIVKDKNNIETEKSNINIEYLSGLQYKLIYTSKKGFVISTDNANQEIVGTKYIGGANQDTFACVTANAPQGKITVTEKF